MAGDIFLGGKVRPGGPFAIANAGEIQGGLHSVADVATRDALTTDLLEIGMLVYTQAEQKYWRLVSTGPNLWIEDSTATTTGGEQPAPGTSILIRYCRSTGSDTTGDGLTPSTAWLTPEHARDSTPIPLGSSLRIDMTGYGTYTPVVRFDIPSIVGSTFVDPYYLFLGPTSPEYLDFGWYYRTDFEIYASPTHLLTMPDGTFTSSCDPVTCQWSFTKAGAGWTVDQWKNKLVWFNTGATIGRVVSNTSDTLVTTLVYSVSTTPLPTGLDLRIQEASCTFDLTTVWNATNSSYFTGAATTDGRDTRIGVTVAGIDFINGGVFNGLGVEYLATIGCSGSFGGVSSEHYYSVADRWYDNGAGYNAVEVDCKGIAQILYTRIEDPEVCANGTSGKTIFLGVYKTGGDSIGEGFYHQGVYSQPSGLIQVICTEARDTGRGGLRLLNNSRGEVGYARFTNCGYGGIRLEMDAQLKITGPLAGTGNGANVGGMGMGVIDSAQVSFNDPGIPLNATTVTLTGTVGDLQVGGNPMRSWSNFFTGVPLNIEEDLLRGGARVLFERAAHDRSNLTTALPVPDATWEGETKVLRGASGVADRSFVCVKNPAGGYAWVSLNENAIFWSPDKTWAQVYAEISQYPENNASVIIASGYTSAPPAGAYNITAGSYDINNVQFYCPIDYGFVNVADGAIFTPDAFNSVSIRLNGVVFQCNGSVTAPGLNVGLWLIDGSAIWNVSASVPTFPQCGPFCGVSARTFFNYAPLYSSTPGLAVFDLATGAEFNMELSGAGFPYAKTIGGDGTVFMTLDGQARYLLTDPSTFLGGTCVFGAGEPHVRASTLPDSTTTAFGPAGTLARSSTSGKLQMSTGSAWSSVAGAASLGWFDVTDYGAVGDGTTDDGPAIQAACDAAASAVGNGRSGIVYFPPCADSYRVATPIVVAVLFTGSPADTFTLQGCGQDSPIKPDLANTQNLFTLTGVGEFFSGRIRNLMTVTHDLTQSTVDCKHVFELGASGPGTWDVQDVTSQGTWAYGNWFHLLEGQYRIANLHDSATIAFGADYSYMIHVDGSDLVEFDEIYSFWQGQYNNTVLQGGTSRALIGVTPRNSANYNGNKQGTRVVGRNIFDTNPRNLQLLYCYGGDAQHVAKGIHLEHFYKSHGGNDIVYVQDCDTLELEHGTNATSGTGVGASKFDLGPRIKHFVLRDVTKGALGGEQVILADAGVAHIEVIDCDLNAATGAPCGVKLANAVATAAFVTTNGVRARVRQVAGAVVSRTLGKLSTTSVGYFTQFTTADAIGVYKGAFLDDGVDQDFVRVVEQRGQQVQFKSDGVGTIGIGAGVDPSTTTNGRVVAGTGTLGVNAGSAVAAVADALCDVL